MFSDLNLPLLTLCSIFCHFVTSFDYKTKNYNNSMTLSPYSIEFIFSSEIRHNNLFHAFAILKCPTVVKLSPYVTL